MNRNLLGLLIALFLFSGCATYNNAKKYYAKHPESFAKDCAGTYVAHDSIGNAIIDYTPANNVDYTGKIDSLGMEAQELYERLLLDSAKALSVSQECSKIVSEYKDKVADLMGKLSALNVNYKKPVPDTFRVETPTFRTPSAIVARLAYNDIQLDSLNKALAVVTNQRDEAKDASKSKTWWIVVLFALLGI